MFAIANKIESTKTFNKVLTYLGCFCFLILCANSKLYLSFSPVPITMHTFAIAVIGCLFPFRVALTCFLAYFVEGLLGSPFFGVALNFGASFGYFIGMIVSIFFLSKVANRIKMPLLLSLVCSSLIIWTFGVLHLQNILGLKKAIMVGIVPFILGDALKLSVAYGLIQYTLKKKTA